MASKASRRCCAGSVTRSTLCLPTKGYDADAVREALDEIEDPLVEEPQAAAGVRAMGHKRRNLIERMFNKLKKCRAISVKNLRGGGMARFLSSPSGNIRWRGLARRRLFSGW